MAEPTKEELIALADRLRRLPAYSGHDMKFSMFEDGQPEETATRDRAVILISERWRDALVDGLLALVGADHG